MIIFAIIKLQIPLLLISDKIRLLYSKGQLCQTQKNSKTF